MAFSSTDAAFEGFRLTRERPRAVAVWIAFYFLATLAVAVLSIAWVGPYLSQMQAFRDTANPDPQQLAGLFQKLAPFIATVLPAEGLFFSVFLCAVYRAVLRPSEARFAFLRLGGDELRMFALLAALFVIGFVISTILLLVVGVAADTLGIGGGAAGAAAGGAIGMAAVGAAAWATVRLWLAAPMTFDRRHVSIAEAWRLTHGRFWPVAIAFLLSMFLTLVISLLVMVISWASLAIAYLATGGSIGAIGQGFQADLGSVRGFLRPLTVLQELFASVMMTVCWIIFLSPAAIVYRALADRP